MITTTTPATIKNVELVTIRQLPWVNRGHVYTITDLLTRLSYDIVGEHNNQRHADYVCASRKDTQIKLQTANGNFDNNWGARPCILTIPHIKGDRHFAAATHNAAHDPNMPRLRDPRDIDHSGHFCVWVLEATTGGSEEYRRSMLAAVRQAYEMAKGMGFAVEAVPDAASAQVQEVPAAASIPTPTASSSTPTLTASSSTQTYITPSGEEIPLWGKAPLMWGMENSITDGQRMLDTASRLEVLTMLHRRLVGWGEQVAPQPVIQSASASYTEAPQQPLQQPTPHFASQPITLTDFEMDALCKMVWAEARGEDELGQRLVVHVIRNRMADSAFPDNLLEVLFQPNQFSPVRNGAFDRAEIDDRIRQRVIRALEEPDQAQEATFFRTIEGAEGSWHQKNLREVFDYGVHRFYKR